MIQELSKGQDPKSSRPGLTFGGTMPEFFTSEGSSSTGGGENEVVHIKQ